ncbi:uncharacterized protein A4U43_C04F30580 [Asparagus officinalis]|uniref:Uncharacterized protein n=1 Tax=Asparagus officinalis TaxID=4686 RepID=A0A5P1F7I8_ASPOF|nr:uncharacterized protein A4U43_C04F30580 [Asparagus officinalis]
MLEEAKRVYEEMGKKRVVPGEGPTMMTEPLGRIRSVEYQRSATRDGELSLTQPEETEGLSLRNLRRPSSVTAVWELRESSENWQEKHARVG